MTEPLLPAWIFWALGSAVFAALTAIFGKVGVAGIDSDVATMLRTVVILAMTVGIVMTTGKSVDFTSMSPRSLAFLLLSGLATGASWLCYFRALKLGPASQVAPVDKLSVVMVAIFGVVFLGEKLSGVNWLGVVFITLGVILVALR